MTPTDNATAATVKERPILFSGPMVRALLAGTKTQTRRLVKPQPLRMLAPAAVDDWTSLADFSDNSAAAFDHRHLACPYGQPGERLWVRETVAIESWTTEFGDTPPLPIDRPWKHVEAQHADDIGYWLWPHYRATDPAPDLGCERDACRVCESGEPGPHWKPSIHMPRWACRIVLEITDVRVERLQAINEQDAKAEGIDLSRVNAAVAVTFVRPLAYEYRRLWESINGDGAWDVNPWVWALTFRVVVPEQPPY